MTEPAKSTCWHGVSLEEVCSDCPGEVKSGDPAFLQFKKKLRHCTHRQSLEQFCSSCSRDARQTEVQQMVVEMEHREKENIALILIRTAPAPDNSVVYRIATYLKGGRTIALFWTFMREP